MYIYLHMDEVNMSLDRQCLSHWYISALERALKFSWRDKKGFQRELRSNCVLIGTLSRCRHAEWRWNGWSLDVTILVCQRLSIGVEVW